jgi:hypothetical protein
MLRIDQPKVTMEGISRTVPTDGHRSRNKNEEISFTFLPAPYMIELGFEVPSGQG